MSHVQKGTVFEGPSIDREEVRISAGKIDNDTLPNDPDGDTGPPHLQAKADSCRNGADQNGRLTGRPSE
jgi:hypothetical protein